MPWSSNGTFLVTVTDGDALDPGHLQAPPGRAAAVGLPGRARPPRGGGLRAVRGARLGPRPPHGAPRRPARARVRSSASSTPTSRSTTSRCFEAGRHLDRLQAMCAFDLLANNTDRKSGHCLVSVGDELFGIDHGLCFHEEFKLRTVIWEFAGEPIPVDAARRRRPLSSATAPRRAAAMPCAPSRTGGRARPSPRPRSSSGTSPSIRRAPLPLATGLTGRRSQRRWSRVTTRPSRLVAGDGRTGRSASQCSKAGGRQRAAQQVALEPVAAELAEPVAHLDGLDAFDHDREAEVVAELDHRPHDGLVGLVGGQVEHERLVDLDLAAPGSRRRWASDE